MSKHDFEPQKDSWVRRSSLLLGATLLRNIGPIFVLLLLARFTNQEMVGQYTLVLALTTPIFVLAQLGLRTVTLTLDPPARFKMYLNVQSTSLVIAFLVSLFTSVMVDTSLIVIVALVCLMKAGDAYADFLSGPLQRAGHVPRIFMASLITAFVSAGATGIALITTQSLELSLLVLGSTSLGITWFVLFLPLYRNAKSDTGPRPEVPWKRVVSAGLPSGIAIALLSLISSAPQYFISGVLGAAATAHFAVLLYIFALADMTTNALTQAWIPSARQFATSHARTNPFVWFTLKSSFRWSLAFLPVIVGGLYLSASAIPFLFGESYTLPLHLALPIGAAILVLPVANFMTTAVSVQNRYLHGISISATSALVGLIGCWSLIPAWGLAGAFWAVAFAVLGRGFAALVVLLTTQNFLYRLASDAAK